MCEVDHRKIRSFENSPMYCRAAVVIDVQTGHITVPDCPQHREGRESLEHHGEEGRI